MEIIIKSKNNNMSGFKNGLLPVKFKDGSNGFLPSSQFGITGRFMNIAYGKSKKGVESCPQFVNQIDDPYQGSTSECLNCKQRESSHIEIADLQII